MFIHQPLKKSAIFFALFFVFCSLSWAKPSVDELKNNLILLNQEIELHWFKTRELSDEEISYIRHKEKLFHLNDEEISLFYFNIVLAKINKIEDQIRTLEGKPPLSRDKCCMSGCQRCPANFGLKKKNKSLMSMCESALHPSTSNELIEIPATLIGYL